MEIDVDVFFVWVRFDGCEDDLVRGFLVGMKKRFLLLCMVVEELEVVLFDELFVVFDLFG